MSNEPKASPETSIVTMWVLLEGQRSPIEVDVNSSEYSSVGLTLNRLKVILKDGFRELRDASIGNIEFFNNDDRTIPLDSGMILTNDTTTSKNPLVVRYPLSELSIKANLKFVNNRKEVCRTEHTTGSFETLQVTAKSKFESLADCKLSDIYFEHQGENIENAYHFNFLVKKFKKEGEDELILDLKVLIRNRKPFSDWKIEEVLRDIYHYENSIIESVSKNFNMEELPQSSPPLSDEVLSKVVEQLDDKKLIFGKVNINEATAREFISIILTNAACFVKKNNDPTTILMVEKQIVGSHGYGPLDYVFMIQNFFVLVTEAKPSDTHKGIAQNLAQIDSMSEMLGKRKIGQTDFEYEYKSMETMPIIGIVTTGRSWIFIRHTPQGEYRRLEVSDEFECLFMGDERKSSISVVVSYVVRLLQEQIRELEQRKSKRVKK